MWPTSRVEAIADQLGVSKARIYQIAGHLGLTRRRKAKKPIPASKTTDRTGQRRFKGVESTGRSRIVLENHHPAIRSATTLFPSTVKPAGRMQNLLKSGHNSRKIGATMEKGRWKRQPIYTLTLEERHTCPRSCLQFDSCYGNNMPFAHRIAADEELIPGLDKELQLLARQHRAGFVIRLHVLGDFFSVPYVQFWREAMSRFPMMNIFGFTARPTNEPIGALLLLTKLEFMDRFMVRWSGFGHETDCSEVVDRPEDATGILCPAESDPDRCCASCGLCAQTDATISFLRH